MIRRFLPWMPALCGAAFPVHPRATTPVLILWAVLLVVAWGAKWPRTEWVRPPRLWWGGAAYYGLIAIGLLWTEALDVGGFALEVKVSLVLMPLLMGATQRWVVLDGGRAALGLWWGLAASAVMGFADAAWSSLLEGDASGWRYAGLSGALHPTYSAWYWAFGVAVWLQRVRGRWAVAGAALAGVMLGLLASKAGWIAGVGVFGVALLHAGRRTAAAVGLLALLVAGATVGQGRALEWIEGMEQVDAPSAASPVREVKSGSTAGRLQAWSAAWSVLRAHPLGVGTGDVKRELQNRYAAGGHAYAAAHGMNAHNAYLEAAVAFGWLGAGWLLIWWGTLFAGAVRSRLELTGTFIALMAWFACTESVFELQSGVVWMAFGLWVWNARPTRAALPSLAAAGTRG